MPEKISNNINNNKNVESSTSSNLKPKRPISFYQETRVIYKFLINYVWFANTVDAPTFPPKYTKACISMH